jgi:hypothetical protein
MLVIGSKALAHNLPNLDIKWNDVDLIAYRKDIDYLINALKPEKIVDKNGLVSLVNIEPYGYYDSRNVEILLADDSESLQGYLKYFNAESGGLKIAPLEVLYSIKKGHIHFPVKFEKHIKHYTILNDLFDSNDKLSDLTKLHFEDTQKRLGKLKTPSLNKSVKNFFDQSNGYVKSYFIHDDIHQVMSHYDEPLYTKLQKDKKMARCEKQLWENLIFEDKAKCVLEEAYVIALERKMIPMLFGGATGHTSKEAFDWALMRICTTLCSGWFRQFATDNFFRIKEYYNPKYVEKFLMNYQNGKIKRNDKSEANKIEVNR